ncbi:MAG: hypothetical protein JWM11_4023 [Planctomycetaceae bacterium]|nr:hypothetical protein [Planctomycetaceae bacterium]
MQIPAIKRHILNRASYKPPSGKEQLMKKLAILLVVIGCGLSIAPAADAGVFIGFGAPAYGPYYPPPPAYYAPPPLVVAPPVLAPRPVFVGPPVYYGRPYGYYGPHWHHGRW